MELLKQMIQITLTQAILLYMEMINTYEKNSKTFVNRFSRLIKLLLNGSHLYPEYEMEFYRRFATSPLGEMYCISDEKYYFWIFGKFPAIPVYSREKSLALMSRDDSRRVLETILAKECILHDARMVLNFTEPLRAWNNALISIFLKSLSTADHNDSKNQFYYEMWCSVKAYQAFQKFRPDQSSQEMTDLKEMSFKEFLKYHPEVFDCMRTMCSSDARMHDPRLTFELQSFIKELLMSWLIMLVLLDGYDNTMILLPEYRIQFDQKYRSRIKRSAEEIASHPVQVSSRGIIKETTPLPYYDPDLRTGVLPFFRKTLLNTSLDTSGFAEGWAEQLQSTKVNTFVNSFSGTIFYFLRIFLSLATTDFRKLKRYFTRTEFPTGFQNYPVFPTIITQNRAHMLSILRAFTNIFVYASGGHTFYEIVYTLRLAPITKALKECFGYSFENLTTEEFLLTRYDAHSIQDALIGLESGLQKSIQYNKHMFNRMAVLESIRAQGKISAPGSHFFHQLR